jgi:hypothetical protein
MPTPPATEDELVATIQRSHLPTVLVEGGEDMMIYRWVEERIGVLNISFLPCGGRDMVLRIFTRRHEFPNVNVAFVADQDLWLFTAIPIDYAEIVWTHGCSIENDLYAGATLEDLLGNEEAVRFSEVLRSIIEWFAFEVEEYWQGRPAEVAKHIDQIVPPGTRTICQPFKAKRGYTDPSPETVTLIHEDYKLRLRGKTLFQILVRLLNRRHGPKHNTAGLKEIAFRMHNPHIYMERLINEVKVKLAL